MVRKTTDSILVRAIAAPVFKMLRSDVHPFSTAFENLDQRSILKFVKGSEKKRVVWTRLTAMEPKWNSVAVPKKYLFAIEDLGRGADGRVWLTCSSSGAVCVLKFALSDKLEETQKEVGIGRRRILTCRCKSSSGVVTQCCACHIFQKSQIVKEAVRFHLSRNVSDVASQREIWNTMMSTGGTLVCTKMCSVPCRSTFCG